MNYLFSPITIKGVTFKNRIVMSPMCQYSASEDGVVTDWHKVHYITRAVGGVGLIMVEATAVEPVGRISNRDLGIWGDDQIQPLKELVALLHKNGAKAGIQIAHAGRKAMLDTVPVGPSSLAFSADYQVPHTLCVEEIKGIVQKFALATQRAKEARFDVIEIHAAHGYLINQFLSPLTNKRTDEYGGSFDNRFRFLQEIVTAVKAVWDGPLFVRVSAEEYVEGGNHIEEYVVIAQRLKHVGVDLIDVSSGAVVPYTINDYPGYQVPYSDKIKNESSILTAAVGKITSVEQAEEILVKNQADFICLGRELLRNPYWVIGHLPVQESETRVPVQYSRAF